MYSRQTWRLLECQVDQPHARFMIYARISYHTKIRQCHSSADSGLTEMVPTVDVIACIRQPICGLILAKLPQQLLEVKCAVLQTSEGGCPRREGQRITEALQSREIQRYWTSSDNCVTRITIRVQSVQSWPELPRPGPCSYWKSDVQYFKHLTTVVQG